MGEEDGRRGELLPRECETVTEPLAAGTVADLIVVLDEDDELIAPRRLRWASKAPPPGCVVLARVDEGLPQRLAQMGEVPVLLRVGTCLTDELDLEARGGSRRPTARRGHIRLVSGEDHLGSR